MAYTPDKPKIAPDSSWLRENIHGWGVDLDPKVRPAASKEHFDPGATGAHWTFPERQVPPWPRERSVEHKFLTPVFGTTCPPRGLSGIIRWKAYTLSEGRLAHWLLLMLADRVDVAESRVTALLRGHPDRAIAEMGWGAEIRRHGLRSRVGRRRADWKHTPLDMLVFIASRAALGFAVFAGVRSLRRRGRKESRAKRLVRGLLDARTR